MNEQMNVFQENLKYECCITEYMQYNAKEKDNIRNSTDEKNNGN